MDMDMDTAPKGPPPGASADDMLADAEASGKLAPLQKLMEDNGWIDAKALMKLAQEDERTKGKSPSELATMIEADTSLYDDLLEYQEGGMLAGKPEKKAPEAPEKDPMKSGDFDARMKAMRSKASDEEM
jgi:hypothetical protein